jgi:hypothetical protein
MVARVKEILDGLWHFSARHERIDTDVSSYWYASGRVLIDPMRPSGGIDALPGEDGPTDVLLTNRHHWRHSGEYVQAYTFPARPPSRSPTASSGFRPTRRSASCPTRRSSASSTAAEPPLGAQAGESLDRGRLRP